MSVNFNWTCPYCGQHTTITAPKLWHRSLHIDTNAKKDKKVSVVLRAIGCPNTDCEKLNLIATLFKSELNVGGVQIGVDYKIDSWNLLPKSKATQFPDYVPEAVRQDYEEACLILNDSPKASATLSRRCLQGIVRDYWALPKSKRGNLGAELNYIKDKCDPDTWSGIDAIRSVGDIGAHMEKDVGRIIEIEPEEAELLVELIETLITDWYVERHKRKARAERAKGLANAKLDQKRAAKKESRLTEQKAVNTDTDGTND